MVLLKPHLQLSHCSSFLCFPLEFRLKFNVHLLSAFGVSKLRDSGDLNLRFPDFTSFGGGATEVIECLCDGESVGPDKIENHIGQGLSVG
jgi:hypothetical protein